MAQTIRNNPCEEHINVRADGFCPVCLVEERDRLRAEVMRLRAVLAEYERRDSAMDDAYHALETMNAEERRGRQETAEYWDSRESERGK